MSPLRGRLLLASAALLIFATAVRGSSNTAAITHRPSLSSPAYAQTGLGVHIVKERPAEEECVTDFYRRVRDKRRAMFGRQLRDHDVAERRGQEDHSLDHYFDHGLPSAHRRCTASKNGNEKEEEEEKSSSCAVRSVRGGGAAEGVMARPSRRPFHYSAASRGGHEDRGRRGDDASVRLDDASSHHRRHGRRGHHHGHSSHHSHRSHHAQDHGLFEDEDDGDFYGDHDAPCDEYGLQEDGRGGDDYPEHHLGLLRVPCSIAINSGEASHHHMSHHASHHRGSSQGKTSMAAYVDTGAQVTVISAAAAKRAGIYHLMDRRYAGRATGVGHCKVLGRIPARHVYFILGEDGDDNCDDEYRDEMDYRGGGEEPYRDDAANTARMDGPALTVLEGTVTRGVDVLLGLDVLQDWEAEIRMGSNKSLTVKKRRNKKGGGGSAVIPFASPARREAEERRPARPTRPAFVERRTHHWHHHHSSKSRSHSSHRRKPHSHSAVDEEEDDEDFSPTASDIESDLDLLDQSGREFPEESYVDKRSIQEMENELLGIDMAGDSEEEGGEGDEDDDEEEDLEEDEEDEDEGEFDMAGL